MPQPGATAPQAQNTTIVVVPRSATSFAGRRLGLWGVPTAVYRVTWMGRQRSGVSQRTGQAFTQEQRAVPKLQAHSEAGRPTAIRFHDLRHTAATFMLVQGVHPKIVSEMLGHASVSITLDLYSHVLPTMQKDATAALDRLLAVEYTTSAAQRRIQSPRL